MGLPFEPTLTDMLPSYWGPLLAENLQLSPQPPPLFQEFHGSIIMPLPGLLTHADDPYCLVVV